MAKVLIVEDHSGQRDILAQMLELSGFEVAVASDGLEGVEKARTWLPDVILMDIRMPRMDGIEATKVLRVEEETADTPIISISAWADAQRKKLALAAGVNEHFTKPLDRDKLLQAIYRFLKSKSIVTPFRNPYIAGPPITNPNMFFGRQPDLKKIISLLPNNFVMLVGPRRIGKTSMLYQLAYHLPELENATEQYVPVLVNVEGSFETEFFHAIMEDIVDVVQKHLLIKKAISKTIPDLEFDLSVSSYSPRLFSRDLQVILKALKPSRLALLLDEMDILNEFSLETQSQLRRIFQRFTNHNLSVVVAGVKLKQRWAGETSPFYNMFMPVELTPFSKMEARRLITEPVKNRYSYDTAAITHIIEATSYMPHRIQQLCLEIIDHLQVAAPQRTKINVEDVNAVLQKIQWMDEETIESDQVAVVAEDKAHYHNKHQRPNDQERT